MVTCDAKKETKRIITEESRNKRCKENAPNNEEESPPRQKKARSLFESTSSVAAEISNDACINENPITRWLINDYKETIASRMPLSLAANDSISKTKIGQDIDKLRLLLDVHGFRTTKISSPREAISLYTDSCRIGHIVGENDDSLRDGKEFLLVAFGVHPQQEDFERHYETSAKNTYCILLFCKKICQVYCDLNKLFSDSTVNNKCATDALDEDAKRLFQQIERTRQCIKEFELCGGCGISSRFAEEQVNALIELCIKVKRNRSYRKGEWRKEYQRICISNSTASNACMFLLQSGHGMRIKDIYLKSNRQEPRYERITIYLYDPTIDSGIRPDFFLLLPGLHTIVTRGPRELVSDMVDFFWKNVIENGYYPTIKLQKALESELRCFLLSGITPVNTATSNLPLPLKANFVPKAPLSIYLHGKAGSGKSSLAKVLPTALQRTLEKYADPECVTRFVKQNLNKSIKTLELEFELRPNNNDMSIMSIVQGRRMAMSQAKPGLVVLNFEEMPMFSSHSNPNQLAISQLICQRFGGRKGSYTQVQRINNHIDRHKAPRNSDKRSIGRDFSLVTIFTSNYPLAEDSKVALQQLELYQSLLTIEMTGIIGSDRCLFAKSYLRQYLLESIGSSCLEISTQNITLNISSQDGDIRPLVRQLRMYAYYIRRLYTNNNNQKGGIANVKLIKVSQHKTTCALSVEIGIGIGASRRFEQDLKIGSLGNWIPADDFIFDSKIKLVLEKIKNIIQKDKVVELAVILEYWLSTTLAPAVILSQDNTIITELMKAIECMGDGIHCIRNINSHTYKMIKSLYDPREMPNLRDDILKFGPDALVVTEIICPTKDSQLCIREMIEDSPSMTAFSSAKSALYKTGLLFAIHIKGEVTPEIMSRVSIVI